MSLYRSKSAFFASGMKSCPIPPSQPSCPICIEALHPDDVEIPSTGSAVEAVQIPNTIAVSNVTVADIDNPHAEPAEDHSPVKVSCCKNVFGRHCLEFWLVTKNSCPFCRAEFFPNPVPQDRLLTLLQDAVEAAVLTAVETYLDERGREEEGEEQEQEEEQGEEQGEEGEDYYYYDSGSESDDEYISDGYHSDSESDEGGQDPSSHVATVIRGFVAGSRAHRNNDLTAEVVGIVAGTLVGMAGNLVRELGGREGNAGAEDSEEDEHAEAAGVEDAVDLDSAIQALQRNFRMLSLRGPSST
jgi:hypothetical protein